MSTSTESADTAAALNTKFGIPGVVAITAGNGGLPRVNVASDLATAEIYLHGAHVTQFQPSGESPVLWLSSKSSFEPNKPIRGGVPICFPWFGPNAADPKLPPHGFARLTSWDLKAVDRHADGTVSVVLTLESNHEMKKHWPQPFKASYTVTVGKTLDLRFETTNTGEQLMTYELALHTYLKVGDVRKISVTGLESKTFLDKTRDNAATSQGLNPVRFTETVDRIYLDTTGTVTVDDPEMGRQLRVGKDGSETTVVWNPFLTAGRPPIMDIGEGEWTTMVCVETANVRKFSVTLSPGESHATTAVIGE